MKCFESIYTSSSRLWYLQIIQTIVATVLLLPLIYNIDLRTQGKHRRRKVEESCVTFLLCTAGWYVHKPDVQNKWDDNTHIYIHTHTHMSYCEVVSQSDVDDDVIHGID